MALAEAQAERTSPLPDLRRILADSRLFWLVLPAFVFFLIFFVVPTVSLFLISFDKSVAGVVDIQWDFTLKNYIRFFNRSLYYEAAIRSIGLAAIVSVVTLALGYPLAYFVAKTRHPGRNTFYMILVLSAMQLDMVIRLFGLMVLMGDNGIINGVLKDIGVIREAAAADVQLLRRRGRARAVHPALHGALADRHHQEHPPLVGGGRAQPRRQPLDHLLAHHLPAQHAGHPRRHAAGLRHLDFVLRRARH